MLELRHAGGVTQMWTKKGGGGSIPHAGGVFYAENNVWLSGSVFVALANLYF